LEDLEVDGRTVLQWMLKKYGRKMCTGFVPLRIESSGKVLWTQ